MSGGHWDYKNDTLSGYIFGWDVSPNYGKEGFGQWKKAVRSNPLEDKELSALLWDVFCLLHSYDWYISGDTNEDIYRADVEYFKKRWFRTSRKDILRSIVNTSCDQLKEELYKVIGERVDEDETGVHQ